MKNNLVITIEDNELYIYRLFNNESIKYMISLNDNGTLWRAIQNYKNLTFNLKNTISLRERVLYSNFNIYE